MHKNRSARRSLQASRRSMQAMHACLTNVGEQVNALPQCPVDSRHVANEDPAFFMAQEGPITIRQRGHTTLLQPEHACIVPAHSGYLLQASGRRARIFSIMPFGGKIVCNSLTSDGRQVNHDLGSTLVPDPGHLAPLLQSLSCWPSKDATGWTLAVRALMHGLSDCLNGEQTFVVGGTTLLAKARLLLAERYTDPDCNAKTLAATLGCHPDYLHRSYREREGVSLRDAIRLLRLQHARKLLLTDRSASVAEVARASGFRHGPRLSEHLRATYGITPSELRRQAHTHAIKE